MSVQSTVAVLRQRHGGPATCRPDSCDACKAMELLDQARDALVTMQERISKGQYDQAGFAAIIRTGLGSVQR